MPLGNTFYFAPPGQGKSLRFSMLVRANLEYARRKQYTNFPFVTESGKSSYIWTKDMILHGIRDSDVWWDEIQMDYDSGEVKTLPPEDDEFFATSGQNGNSINVASQGLTRVTKGIRDRMNFFVKVEVVLELPGLRNARGGWFRPVIFREVWWQSWEDIGKKDRIYLSRLFFFNMKSAICYDTTWFAGQRREPPKPVSWLKAFESRGGDNERFTEHINKIRSSGLWQVTKRFIVSQGREILIRYLNISALRRMLGTCQENISSVARRFAVSLRSRLLQDCNQGGQRGSISYLPCWPWRGSRNKGDPRELDQAIRSDPVKCPVDQEVPGVLSGDDQAAEVSPLQQFQGVALAWSQRYLEEDMQRADTLVSGFCGVCEDLLEPENSSEEMAGRDTKGSGDEK